MLQRLVFLPLALVTAGFAVAQAPSLIRDEDRASYAIGVDLARNLKRQGIEVELEMLIKGLRDGASGEKLLISELELRDIRSRVQNQARQVAAQSRGKPLAEANLRRGEQFLSANRTNTDVVVLPNGLQYKVLKPGQGRTPTAEDTVDFYYRATRLDGTEFLCTNAGEPATLKLKEMEIAGWREALQRMPVGAKWRLFIPPQLAYGPQSVGRDLGPNETIISDLELVAIK